jgi:methylated-DNA-[protein]-cysteine S-methyltransferase
MTVYFTLFDTAIGGCAIAWGARGIACVQLPEANDLTTRARVLQRFPRAREAAPPSEVFRAQDAIARFLRGEPGDLSSVRLDMDLVAPFHRRVYEAARSIPQGTTLTYGALAARARRRGLGSRRWASARPKPVCDHRALPSGGRGRRPDRRFLGEWRHRNEIPAPRDRRPCGLFNSPGLPDLGQGRGAQRAFPINI